MSEHIHELNHTIELRGVYDGISIFAYTDGCLVNRWAGADGKATPGYERRWEATEKAIEEMRQDPPKEN